jgi:DNA-binding SARP family transcriptional activator
MKFRVLGEVTAEIDGAPVDLGGLANKATLAVLLASRGLPVTLSQLTERGPWDGKDGTSTNAVHSRVSRLEACLQEAKPRVGKWIRWDGTGYRMPADVKDVDAYRFDDLAKTVRRLDAKKTKNVQDHAQVSELGREALSEWGAGNPLTTEPLLGLTSKWAAGMRQHYRGTGLAIWLACLNAESQTGEAASILPDLEFLHRTKPRDQQILRLLMLALARLGQQTRAMSLSDQLRDRLDPDTAVLYEQIKNGDFTTLSAESLSAGATAMPSHEIAMLAARMCDVLAPTLPFLTGAEAPASAEHVAGESWETAKALWRALQRRGVTLEPAQTPDVHNLRVQLQDALSRDPALVSEASSVFTDRERRASGQIVISGPYFHQGDTISGTSIKYYG